LSKLTDKAQLQSAGAWSNIEVAELQLVNLIFSRDGQTHSSNAPWDVGALNIIVAI